MNDDDTKAELKDWAEAMDLTGYHQVTRKEKDSYRDFSIWMRPQYAKTREIMRAHTRIEHDFAHIIGWKWTQAHFMACEQPVTKIERENYRFDAMVLVYELLNRGWALDDISGLETLPEGGYEFDSVH